MGTTPLTSFKTIAQLMILYDLKFCEVENATRFPVYFTYLVSGFYTAWLLPAAVVGFFVFLYGVFAMWNYVPA